MAGSFIVSADDFNKKVRGLLLVWEETVYCLVSNDDGLKRSYHRRGQPNHMDYGAIEALNMLWSDFDGTFNFFRQSR